MIESSEREMVQKFDDDNGRRETERVATSLQPTYEDTVWPDPEHDWAFDE